MLRVGYHSCEGHGLGGGEGRTKGQGPCQLPGIRHPALGDPQAGSEQHSDGLKTQRARWIWSILSTLCFLFFILPEFSVPHPLTVNQGNSCPLPPWSFTMSLSKGYPCKGLSLYSVCLSSELVQPSEWIEEETIAKRECKDISKTRQQASDRAGHGTLGA